MTMEGMNEPLLIQDEEKSIIANPGEEIITKGAVVERRLPKYQSGEKLIKRESINNGYGVRNTYLTPGTDIIIQQPYKGPPAAQQFQGPRDEWEKILRKRIEDGTLDPREILETTKYGYPSEKFKEYLQTLIPGSIRQEEIIAEPIPTMPPTFANIQEPKFPGINIPPTTPVIPEQQADDGRERGLLDRSLVNLGYNFYDSFINKPITPPEQLTNPLYTPELLRPYLQDDIDAQTSVMRNLNRVRGNALSKNANLASSAMQRARNTTEEINKIDNANVGILNDAQLKNIGLVQGNNQVLYNNAVNNKLVEADRRAKQSEWTANFDNQVNTMIRDRNAKNLSDKQLEMIKEFYGVSNPVSTPVTPLPNTGGIIPQQQRTVPVNNTKETDHNKILEENNSMNKNSIPNFDKIKSNAPNISPHLNEVGSTSTPSSDLLNKFQQFTNNTSYKLPFINDAPENTSTTLPSIPEKEKRVNIPLIYNYQMGGLKRMFERRRK